MPHVSLPRRGTRTAAAIAVVLGLALMIPASAPAAKRSIAPSARKHGVLTFKLAGITPTRITRAVVKVGPRASYPLRLARVRGAARHGQLKVRVPLRARRQPHLRVRLVLSLRSNVGPTQRHPATGGGSGGSTAPGVMPPIGGQPEGASVPTASVPTAPAAAGQPSFPIRAAFYYPWYPETWHDHGGPTLHFHPSLGHYASADTALQTSHIRSLEYAGMDAAISEWTPPPDYRDARLRHVMALTTALGSPLKWAIYYTPEDKTDPTPSSLAADLRYIRDTLAASPAYLRVGGRPVVVVWTNTASDATCALTDRWKAANDQAGEAAYVVQKIFRGYAACPSQPDAWHQYGPASPTQSVAGQAFTVSPGHWRFDEATPRLARDPARFRQNVAQMVASRAPWQLVTTFNEWGAGTSVESATEWQSTSGQGAYLDILHAALRPG